MVELCQNCKRKVEELSVIRTSCPFFCSTCGYHEEEEVKKLVASEELRQKNNLLPSPGKRPHSTTNPDLEKAI